MARDGYGDMAVSNAIGSNVFDINLGLGLPFALRIAIDAGAPISLLSDAEWVRLSSVIFRAARYCKIERYQYCCPILEY